jgi:myo-inositol catabolism protein IolS
VCLKNNPDKKVLDTTNYVELGKSGLRVSPIILGCWQFARDANFPNMTMREAEEIIDYAVNAGINMLDTAESYGKGYGEELLGKICKGFSRDLFIATKVREYNLIPEKLRQAVENSLSRLQRETIDLYQIHWPTGQVKIEDTMAVLEDLKKEGKIRSIGISNFMLEDIQLVMNYASIDSLQSPYNLLWRCLETPEFEFCASNNISVFAYSPLAQGLLAGNYDLNELKPKRVAQEDSYFFQPENLPIVQPVLKKVQELAERFNSSMSGIALRYVLSKSFISGIVIGVSSKAQLIENLKSVQLPLSNEDLHGLDDAGESLLRSIDSTRRRSIWNWWPDKQLSADK